MLQIQWKFIAKIKLTEIGRDNFFKITTWLNELANRKEISNAYIRDFLLQSINLGEKVNVIKTHSSRIEVDSCSDLSLDTTLARLKVIKSFDD